MESKQPNFKIVMTDKHGKDTDVFDSGHNMVAKYTNRDTANRVADKLRARGVPNVSYRVQEV